MSSPKAVYLCCKRAVPGITLEPRPDLALTMAMGRRSQIGAREGARTLVAPENASWPGTPMRVPLLARENYELLRLTLRNLRIHAPPAFRVILRTGGVPFGTEGCCIRRKKRFVIHLAGNLSPVQSSEVLVHEWAHGVAWSHLHDRACSDLAAGLISEKEFSDRTHDASFGIEFARCWRVYSGIVLPEYDELMENKKLRRNAG